ncbi:MAG: radical SAM protein, partial [Acidobacteriaceae bacterium]|nr:radical SAM protein [Acidobacteriaceae bacterium]
MAGVYISYPFCSQKCSFCNFASGVFSADTIARYAQRLTAEIRAHEWKWLPETVYFGGGTPSLMDPDLLQTLTWAIPKERITEATLECAPGTLTPDKLRLWTRLGINRVSLGVQSFVS